MCISAVAWCGIRSRIGNSNVRQRYGLAIWTGHPDSHGFRAEATRVWLLEIVVVLPHSRLPGTAAVDADIKRGYRTVGIHNLHREAEVSVSTRVIINRRGFDGLTNMQKCRSCSAQSGGWWCRKTRNPTWYRLCRRLRPQFSRRRSGRDRVCWNRTLGICRLPVVGLVRHRGDLTRGKTTRL